MKLIREHERDPNQDRNSPPPRPAYHLPRQGVFNYLRQITPFHLAECLFFSGEKERAVNHLHESIEQCEAFNNNQLLLHCRLAQADVEIQRGNHQSAEQILTDLLTKPYVQAKQIYVGHIYFYLGRIKKHLGSLRDSAYYHKQSLRVKMKNPVDPWLILDNIIDVADLMIQLKSYDTAVKLLAAASELRDSYGIIVGPEEQTYFDEMLSDVQEKVEAELFAHLRELGAQMTLNQVIKFAIEQCSLLETYDSSLA